MIPKDGIGPIFSVLRNGYATNILGEKQAFSGARRSFLDRSGKDKVAQNGKSKRYYKNRLRKFYANILRKYEFFYKKFFESKFRMKIGGYVLWKTLGLMVKNAGLGDELRRVLEELGKIRLVDVVLPTSSGVEIRKRCITRPTEHQEILLQYLGLKIPRQFKK